MKKYILLSLLAVLFYLIPIQPGYTQLKEEAASIEGLKTQLKLDIVLVLDNSGSMKKNDPEFLTQKFVAELLTGFGENCRVGMVVFDQSATLVEPLTDMTDQLGRANLSQSINKVDFNGLFTNTPAGIERAMYELKIHGRSGARRLIILLTDGIIDTGNKQRDLVKEKWLKETLTEESKQADIRIFSIAFTDKADFSLIQTLAIKTDGEYFRAYQAEDIQNIFHKISGMITKPPDKHWKPKASPAKAASSTSPAMDKGIPALQKSESVKLVPTAKIETQTPTVLQIVPPGTEKPSGVQKESLFLLIILTGIFLLLLIILTIMIFNLKSRTGFQRGVTGSGGLDSRKTPDIPRAKLIDVKNITAQKTFTLDKRIIRIGRDPNNDIEIAKDTVSSFHAIIEYQDGFFYIEDQRSKNKTRLNGRAIGPYSAKKLKNGDEIMFNIYKFIFIRPDLIPAGDTVMDFHKQSDTVRLRNTTESEPDNVCTKPPPVPQAVLIDAQNITGQKTFILTKRKTKIGRGVHNEIAISEKSISGSHATIEYKDGSFYIEDQRSTNKTCINREEIEPYAPRKLKSGDEIMFDVYKFIFLLERQLPTGDTGRRLPEE